MTVTHDHADYQIGQGSRSKQLTPSPIGAIDGIVGELWTAFDIYGDDCSPFVTDSLSLPSARCCWSNVRLYDVIFPNVDSSLF